MKPLLPLNEGEPAPNWTALDQDGETVLSDQFLGSWLVLFFYPRDLTPGCTQEACGFRDHYESLRDANAHILGVSTDSGVSHRKFANKHQLPFPLLVDEDKHLVTLFGVWGPKQFMGRTFDGTHRTTFLMDPEGRVAKIWRKVKPRLHSEEVLEVVKTLSGH